MRFEHLIEVNAPAQSLQLVAPTFTREQLWQGLMLLLNLSFPCVFSFYSFLSLVGLFLIKSIISISRKYNN